MKIRKALIDMLLTGKKVNLGYHNEIRIVKKYNSKKKKHKLGIEYYLQSNLIDPSKRVAIIGEFEKKLRHMLKTTSKDFPHVN